jgi:DNA topoisomerase-1
MKTSRYGAFIGCSNYPECRYTRSIAQENGEDEAGAGGDRELGVDPVTGRTIWLKAGRFGPYVEEAGEKPKRASLPKDWPPAAMDLDKAIRLLRLPREVGAHPDDGKPIVAGIGRYGPYVAHDGTYANLPNADEVFEVGLNRAVAVLAEKRAGRSGRSSGGAEALAELGAHPADGQPVRVLAGRYGPYIKHAATNANVPRGADPAALTLDEAVKLLAEREAKGPGKGRRGRPAARATAAKTAKAAAPAKVKKPAAKKKPAKTRKPK